MSTAVGSVSDKSRKLVPWELAGVVVCRFGSGSKIKRVQGLSGI